MAGATQNTPAVDGGYNLSDAVKVPERFLISLREDQLPIDVMTSLIFENIGGKELLSLSRTDTLNGQNVKYTPIKNLAQLNVKWNSNNIIPTGNNTNKYFNSFPIKLEEYIPDAGSGYVYVDGLQVPTNASVYIDPDTGDLVIDLINMQKGYQVDVQFLTDGTAFNDTID